MSGIEKTSILIIDDQRINRMILRNILSSEYSIFEAENGKEGFNVLEKNINEIGAVLLDLIMPVMDGFQFLAEISRPQFASIPIIVLTGEANDETEKKVLDQGAWDFITKPYQPVILKTRLKNAIARSRMGMYEKMKVLAEHDALTGLYNRSHFFERTRKMIDANPDTTFVFIRIDIDRFSLINSFWGEEEGDRLLKYVAGCIRSESQAFEICTYSHINSDIFCFSAPYDEEKLLTMTDNIRKSLLHFKNDYYIKPTFGLYIIRDSEQPVETMYEKAAIASKTCKGTYNQFISYYDRQAHEELKWEQEVTSRMQQALDSGEFIPWMQPKYSLKSELPCGSEALVRWNHPTLGILSPAKFIPIFERNGFVSKLDYCIWESVCRIIRHWMDEGNKPIPVSVNVSLVDLYNPNIVQILCELIRKYRIPAASLNLELTESAYMDNPNMIKKVMNELHEKGFVIMMDDFGSGYSSLNTLKEIPVDILKIDMGFLRDADKSTRSRKILASMILMAGWLDIPVIVEGVETRDQVEFLKSVGCNFVQGYYYGKPMPPEEYERLVREKVTDPDIEKSSRDLSDRVWNTTEEGTAFLYHFAFPAAVYEYYGSQAYAVRVNKALNEAFGYKKELLSFDRDSSIFPKKDLEKILAFCDAAGSGYPKINLTVTYLDRDGRERPVTVLFSFMGLIQSRKIFCVFFAFHDACDGSS